MKNVDDMLIAHNGDLEAAITDLKSHMSGLTPEQLARAGHEQELNTLEGLRGQVTSQNTGKMYEVNINADPEHFLDWDKPLSEQPETLRNALPGMIQQYGGDLQKLVSANGDLRPAVPGQSVYQALSKAIAGNENFARNPPQAADVLRDAGIPGIKYLDQGSRGAGKGTRNYVVFNDKLIDLIKKYGIAGMASGAAAQSNQDNAR